MDAIEFIGLWFLLSIPVSLLVGRMIRFGTGEEMEKPDVNIQ
jgi:hypothetical protein